MDKELEKNGRSTARSIIGIIIGGFLIALAVTGALLFRISYWITDTWTNLTTDQFMYQAFAPKEGTSPEMILDATVYCLPLMLAVLAAGILLWIFLRKKNKLFIFYIVTPIVAVLLSALGFYHIWNNLSLDTYVEAKMEDSEFIEGHYVDPASVDITFPEKKNNLVYIYLESMEVTFTDPAHGGAFEDDLIPNLTELVSEGEDFGGDDPKLNGGYVMPGTSFTMGGMFGQSSGLPLVLGIHDANSLEMQDRFFGDIITLGDILENEGYNRVLMFGSDAAFGGRRQYYRDHGNYKIWDYNYAIKTGMIPEDYHEFWGYEDHKLFDFAKDALNDLAAEEEPFAITLLTVDTHFEDGYICEYCDDKYDDQLSNVYACSDREVTEFVRWLQKQDFYEDTTVILAGDHLTMDSDFCIDVPSDYGRRTYVNILNAKKTPADPLKRRDFTTLDMFPTTLSAMGADIAGGRLGLGADLFSSTPTLSEEYGNEYIETELNKGSDFVDKLANLNLDDQEWQKADGSYPMVMVYVEDYDNDKVKLKAIQCNRNAREKLKTLVLRISSIDGEILTTTSLNCNKRGEFSKILKLDKYPIDVSISADGIGESGIEYKECMTSPKYFPGQGNEEGYLPLMNRIDMPTYFKCLAKEIKDRDIDLILVSRTTNDLNLDDRYAKAWRDMGLEIEPFRKKGNNYAIIKNGEIVSECSSEDLFYEINYGGDVRWSVQAIGSGEGAGYYINWNDMMIVSGTNGIGWVVVSSENGEILDIGGDADYKRYSEIIGNGLNY